MTPRSMRSFISIVYHRISTINCILKQRNIYYSSGSKVFDFNCKIIRYNNVFGPKMGFGHVIPHLVERFLGNEIKFKIYGADQTRSFCYIDDGALGTIQAMECEAAKNEIFHIGSEDEITIEELVKEVGKFFDFKGEYIKAMTYPGSVSRRCPDLSKAKKILKYKPEVDWKDGLKITLEWYKNYYLSNNGFTNFEPPEKFI